MRIASGPAFLATKWEAFRDRGSQDDLWGSSDIEDIITVVAGRPELRSELPNVSDEMRTFIAQEAARFLAHEDSREAISGALPDAKDFPGLIDEVIARFRSFT
ncbi:MAG: hypothetical protein JWO05_268 [Gemmatimonadetes bacterium]|nr:hypothetical protein [Gemmatimonadota bacterium]